MTTPAQPGPRTVTTVVGIDLLTAVAPPAGETSTIANGPRIDPLPLASTMTTIGGIVRGIRVIVVNLIWSRTSFSSIRVKPRHRDVGRRTFCMGQTPEVFTAMTPMLAVRHCNTRMAPYRRTNRTAVCRRNRMAVYPPRSHMSTDLGLRVS